MTRAARPGGEASVSVEMDRDQQLITISGKIMISNRLLKTIIKNNTQDKKIVVALLPSVLCDESNQVHFRSLLSFMKKEGSMHVVYVLRTYEVLHFTCPLILSRLLQ